MVKCIIKNILSPFSFNKDLFNVYKKNKDKSIFYRCKFCRVAKIKKVDTLYYKMSGHSRNCKSFMLDKISNIKVNKINCKNKIKIHKRRTNSSKVLINKKKITKKQKKSLFTKKNNWNFSSLDQNNMTKITIDNYIFYPERIIGKGSFVNTYFGYNLKNSEEVAIKINKEKKKISTSTFEIEVLRKAQGFIGFPEIYGFCKYGKYDVIIEKLLGPSLKRLIEFYEKPFSIPTISLIGIEILKRLKTLHKLNILHNDIKPSNFSWGVFKNNKIQFGKTIFIIDFGLCSVIKFGEKRTIKDFSQEETNDKVKVSLKNTKKYGNLLYMSEEVLNGAMPTKKTEVTSFVYLLIYLINLKLPWSNIKCKNYQGKIKKIIDIHKKTDDFEMCKSLPYQIQFIFL